MIDKNTPTETDRDIVPPEQNRLEAAGHLANQYARSAVFEDYLLRRSMNTIRRHRADLALFALYLQAVGAAQINAEMLQNAAESWRGITWGLIEGFKRWMLQQGYAANSVNARLSTIRTYARLALKAGVIDAHEFALVQQVHGYSHHEALRVDEKRTITRRGAKKAQPIRITPDQADLLKQQPDTPQGRRDALIIHLLLDHGLRAGELAALRVENVNRKTGMMRFYREKVAKEQVHRLTPEAYDAVNRWVESGDCLDAGLLLRGSRKDGKLSKSGMTTRAIAQRVRAMGQAIGLEGLSPHDCRHYWATQAIQAGTDPFALKQAGGWASMATVSRYVADAEVANDGIILRRRRD